MAVTDKLFNEGINRLSGSMFAGHEEDAVKKFEFENFQMEV